MADILIFPFSNPETMTAQVDGDQLILNWPSGREMTNGDFLVVPLSDFVEAARRFRSNLQVEVNGFRLCLDSYRVFIENHGAFIHMYYSTWEYLLKELIVRGYLQTKKNGV